MTTPVEEEFEFATGAEGAKEQSKSGAQFQRTEFYNLDDGETIIVRFISEHTPQGFRLPMSVMTLSVQMHSMVPTKNKPADWPDKAKWPQTMGAVCRKDKAFKGKYPDCFISDFMKKSDGKSYTTSGRTFALACIREEVKENGRVVGLKDAVREVQKMDKDGKPDGDPIKEKRIVVFTQAYKNFWSIMEGFGGRYGTITDRDYQIKRVGKDTSTVYHIVPLDPIPMVDGEGRPVLENGQIVGRSFRMKPPSNPDEVATEYIDPEWVERYKHEISLPKVVAEQASDDYYARFFDTRVESPPLKKSEGSSPDTPTGPPPPDNDVDEDAMKALVDRVKGHPGQEAAAAPQNGAPPQQEQPQGDVPAAAGGMRDFG